MTTVACGVDIGSTNLKVVLLDDEGRTVWVRSMRTPRRPDRDSVATDAAELVATIETMIVAGWQQVGGGVPLRAIACAGVGEDGIGLARDLAPTGLALAWFDERARLEAAELSRHPAADARIGLAVGADRTLAKWLWLARHDRAALDRAVRGWAALTDYPAVRWTGRPFISRSLAARTAAYDVFSRAWIEPLLAAAGAPSLPEVLDAGTVVGTVTSGPLRDSGAASAKTLVVAGGHDHPVAAAAIRRAVPGARVDSLGTANVLYGEIDHPIRPLRHPCLAFSVPVRPGPGVACLGVIELAAALGAAKGGRSRLSRLLAGDRLPGRPGGGTARGDAAVRGHLEAVTFRARDGLAALDAVGVPPGPLYATGGWSRSRAFMELRASIFATPVHIVDEPELVAVSAALIAAEGAGMPLPFEAVTDARRVDPDPVWAEAYAAAAGPRPAQPLEAGRLQEGAPPP